MGRPRTSIGTFGEFTYISAPNGRTKARVRFRDDDGQLRLVQATGETRKAAERALKQKLSRRDNYSAGSRDLSADSTFGRLVEVWLVDLDLTGKLAESTRALYERNMRQLVMPAFENYTLREISVRKVDEFIKKLASTKSYSTAKQARTVLSLAFGLAVRYDALNENPVETIRAAVRGWRRGPGLPGPPPDGQLEQIIEVMLGTSARIGEVLAIRKCDVDVTVSPARVRICGTIVSPAGKPTHRQQQPKTQKSTRVVSVPSFAAEAIRQRLVVVADEPGEHLLFVTRNGTPLTTNNIRRRLRAVLSDAGIEGVSPHAFRRTVATVLDRASGSDLAAEMLGHTSSRITKQHYIEPDETVNPVTADILEALAPKGGTGVA
jgi:integrase